MKNGREDQEAILRRFDAAGRYRDEVRLTSIPSNIKLRELARQFGMTLPVLQTALRLRDVFTRDQMVTLAFPPKGLGLSWGEFVQVTAFENWHDAHKLAQEADKKRWGKKRFVDAIRQLAQPAPPTAAAKAVADVRLVADESNAKG